MPIRINLLAEDQAAEEMRRKDPVKRAIWIAGFVVFLVLLYGFTVFLKSTVWRMELAGLEAQWRSMEKACRQVEFDRTRTADIEKRLSALTQFTTNRFLWANALNALQQTSVEHIQIVRFKAEQIYVAGDPAKGATNRPAAAAPAASATANKPTLAIERIVLHLDGRDFSPRAPEQVTRFKEVLAGVPFFQSTLQKTNAILLTSLSAPQADGSGKNSFVVFGLQINFAEKERKLYE
ncbi:MAG: hypothetical protein HZA90_10215 [Verrucomicrobia bacterium]|nr:hypothetical protein [Verrucomicrobiota bacterium]